ncbi:MAG: hypothetical protein GX802_00370, partial [Clostridiales bacterium]|nr:hypothetical protein [Clostridiales bacterium]
MEILNGSSIIKSGVHCPYCGSDDALLINQKQNSTISLRTPAFGLKYILSLYYLGILQLWINGWKLFEVNKNRTYNTYAFCPKCGNNYSAQQNLEV